MPASALMTREVVTCTPNDLLADLMATMTSKRIRHLPVLHRKRVVGMISIGDLNKADHDGQVETIRYLEQFMSVA